jgi:hypothetical protein
MNKSPSSSIPAAPGAGLSGTRPAAVAGPVLPVLPALVTRAVVSAGPVPAHASPAAPKEDLVYAVRHYVHFDNLAETLNKQVTNVRNMRTKFENEILTMLEVQGMKNAVLQISGATLQRQTRHQSTNLSWSFLEEQLHEYYKSKGRLDETEGILDFVQKHRGGRVVDYLKKTTTVAGGAVAK